MDAAFSARLPAGATGLGGLDELGEPEVMKVESSIQLYSANRGR